MKITRPTLLVDKAKAIVNLDRMIRKVRSSPNPVRFRPHFKTHQSWEVGRWFRQRGVTAITVSSLDMAAYFARDGWRDITVALLVNPRQIGAINRLASAVELGLLVDTVEMVRFLDEKLRHPVNIWVKVDCGYHRTGIEWERREDILAMAEAVTGSSRLRWRGLLTHAGHSYKARSVEQLRQIYGDTLSKMSEVRAYLEEKGIAPGEISIGDTPTCSALARFGGIDEVRCGNFIFYDVMQLTIGSCREKDIAVAVGCPVIARYPHRNELVIHGGAVHLSKESITDSRGEKIFGLVARPIDETGRWGRTIAGAGVTGLSQEHGVIKTTGGGLDDVRLGDLLMILPVHSCLCVDLMRRHPWKIISPL